MENCIEFTGALNAYGYGVKWDPVRRKVLLAHRYAVNAPDGSVVRHLCDNRKCVNPDHLRIGTQKENMEDAVSKGRTAAGQRNGRATLTDEMAEWVRQSPQKQADIAFALGVSQQAVSMIKGGKRRAYSHPSY